MSRVSHIIWDWNGTLFDDVGAALIAINAMLEVRQLPLLDLEGYRRRFGFPVIDCYRALGFKFSTHAEWDAVAKEFHSVYNRHANRYQLVPGASETLAQLSAAGIPMSVLSASEVNTLRNFLKFYSIDGFFANILGHSDLYGSSKIELGCSLMTRIEVDPSTVLLVGDTRHDFEVAQAMGCRCVLYLNGHQDRVRLEGCGCQLISDIREIAAGLS